MKTVFLAAALLAYLCPQAMGDAATLPGKDFPFKSSGSKIESGGWELTGNDYLGTYLTLPKPGRVVWDTDLTLKTDRKGKVRFGGFFGDYSITVGGRSYAVVLAKGKDKLSVRLGGN